MAACSRLNGVHCYCSHLGDGQIEDQEERGRFDGPPLEWAFWGSGDRTNIVRTTAFVGRTDDPSHATLDFRYSDFHNDRYENTAAVDDDEAAAAAVEAGEDGLASHY